MPEPTILFTGTLIGFQNHGTIVILVLEADGQQRLVHCDHRMGWAIWEDLAKQEVELCESEDDTEFIRPA